MASGMAAIMAVCLAHLKNGDHIVASSGLFGATVQLFSNILARTGISTTFVPQTDPSAWEAAIRPETKLFFLETPSNPLTEIADISALTATGADLAVARTFDQPHPVFCLCRRDVLPHLTEFLAGGGRKIDRWYATLKVVEVAFDDEADAFENINTREELGRFESNRED